AVRDSIKGTMLAEQFTAYIAIPEIDNVKHIKMEGICYVNKNYAYAPEAETNTLILKGGNKDEE
ncbi:MAG: hypothetical protein KKE64_07070, partial [Candidatus Omnitrophica bacterium]|nr:hypothetical protein [Candidatus Omnitrophota bacterium]